MPVVTQKPEENVNVFSKWLVSGGIWEWLGIYLMGFNKSGNQAGVLREPINPDACPRCLEK